MKASIGGFDDRAGHFVLAMEHRCPAVLVHVSKEAAGVLAMPISSLTVQPGFTTIGDQPYISMYFRLNDEIRCRDRTATVLATLVQRRPLNWLLALTSVPRSCRAL